MSKATTISHPEALHWKYFHKSDKKTRCGWKGMASYYDVNVGDQVNRDAASTHPDPCLAASKIKNYVASWRGVSAVD